MSAEAFLPQLPAVSVLAAGAVSVSVQLNGGNAIGTNDLMVSNENNVWGFIRFDASPVAAVFPTPGNVGTTGVPVPPNTSIVIRINPNVTYAAAILRGAGTSAFTFTPGEGKL